MLTWKKNKEMNKEMSNEGRMVNPVSHPAGGSQVLEWLNNLDQSVVDIECIAKDLITRLQPVLRDESPSADKAVDSEVEPALVPVADRIRTSSGCLERIHKQLRDAIEHLEV